MKPLRKSQRAMISPSLEREAIVTMPSCRLREDAQDNPAVPERVDERNARGP